ncbi:MAG: MarR family winged helix-turn-helix transcriptional regulator [Dehalococcoidia bacterium]
MAQADQSLESLAAEDAARFKRRFDWINEQDIETNLEVASAYASLMAAFSRCLSAIGESRTTGRTKILRLLYLSEHERLPQHEIGRQLGVTSANVTYLIDGLEKEGLVRRIVNQADRRVTFVELTEKGDELSKELVPLIGEFMTTTASALTESEKQQFIELLVKFRTSAEASYLD